MMLRNQPRHHGCTVHRVLSGHTHNVRALVLLGAVLEPLKLHNEFPATARKTAAISVAVILVITLLLHEVLCCSCNGASARVVQPAVLLLVVGDICALVLRVRGQRPLRERALRAPSAARHMCCFKG